MENNTDPNPGPAPFSLEALQKDALPIVLVGMVTAFVSFSAGGDAYDRHWTSAWALISVAAVVLAATRTIRLTHPPLWGVGMVILTVQAFRGGHCQWEALAMWIWLWTWVWTLPQKEGFFWRGIKALPLFAAVIGGIMLLQALKLMWNGDWGHTESYAMTLPWAHRNIAMEAMFMMCVLGGHLAREKWWRWWGFITVLALIYQVRGVLLGCTLWMLCAMFITGQASIWIKRSFLAASLLFVSVQVYWNMIPSDIKQEQFSKAPDILKSLDVVYNLNGAESSSIRTKLWRMTASVLRPQGEGLARWRDDAEGFVNLAHGRCDEATRRAHSELLQWSYELGWVSLLLLIGMCWPLRRSMGRWLWFTLPFLAFTFPMERAEILWPMAMLGWWIKSQLPPEESRFSVSPHLLTGAFGIALVLVLSWVTAQNAIGGVLRQSGAFKVDWSPIEEACVNLHPKDIALNHADVIRAMSHYNAGRIERGKALIDAHLEKNPLSIPAIRVHLKSKGLPHDEEAVCAYLQEAVNQGATRPAR